MKAIRINDNVSHYIKHISALFFLMTINIAAFAQRVDAADDKNRSDNRVTTEFNYDTRETPWYLQPWVWAIVAALLILFIAWATKGSMKRHMESDSESGAAH